MRKYELDYRKSKKKDKSGNYREWTSTTYYLIYYENRKKKYIDTRKSNIREAEDEKERLIKEIEGGTVYSVIKNNKWLSEKESPLYLSYKAHTTDYHYQYAQSQKNVRYLKIILEQFKDEIGDKLFCSLSPEDVDDFLIRLSKYSEYKDAKKNTREITNAFRNCTIDAFSTIYNYYLRTGEIKVKSNPFYKKKRFPKKTEHRKRFIYTPEIINLCFEQELLEKIEPITLIETAHGEKPLSKEKWLSICNSIYKDFFHFVALTGMRGSEASSIRVNQFVKDTDFRVLNINGAFKAGLRKNDVDNNDGSVDIIGTTKSGKPRRIVLCDEANRIIKKYAYGKTEDDLIFINDNKKSEYSSFLLSQERARVFRIFINELNAQFNFTDDPLSLTIHGFRTSLNSVLIDNTGLRESLIAHYFGWESTTLQKTQLKHYTQYSDADLRSVANEINKLYSGREMIWQPIIEKKNSLDYQDRRIEILSGRKLDGIALWRSQIRNTLLSLKRNITSGEYFGEEYQEEGSNSFEYQYSNLDKTVQIIDGILQKENFEIADCNINELLWDDGFKYEINEDEPLKKRIIELQKEYTQNYNMADTVDAILGIERDSNGVAINKKD